MNPSRKSWQDGPVRMSLGGQRSSGEAGRRPSKDRGSGHHRERGSSGVTRGRDRSVGASASKLPVPGQRGRPSAPNGGVLRRSNSAIGSSQGEKRQTIASSSSKRTPMSVRSISANRFSERKHHQDFMTPQRLGNHSSKKSYFASENKGSRMSGRGSAIGSKNVRDTRPLTDKAYQLTQVKKILDFLRENRYPNDNLTSKHFPLSTKEFTNIFNFAYSFIEPNEPNVLPQGRAEEKILHILKTELQYPGNITKSSFVTLGSMHSWPAVLGCLSFLCETANIYTKIQENIIPMAFPSLNEDGFPTDTESKEKIRFEHQIKCYINFNDGSDDHSAMREELRERLMENNGVDPRFLHHLQKEYNSLKVALEQQLKQPDTRDGLMELLKRKEADLEKLAQYGTKVLKTSEDLSKRQGELAEMKAEAEARVRAAEADLQALKEENSKGPSSIQMSSQLEVDKRLALTQTKEDIAALNNEIGQIEVVLYRTHDVLEKMVRKFNRICMDLGVEAPNGGDGFLSLPLPELNDGVAGVGDEIHRIQEALLAARQTQQHTAHQLGILEENLKAHKERVKIVIDKAAALTEEHSSLEQLLAHTREAVKEEEEALDTSIKELKAQLIRLGDDAKKDSGEWEAILEEKKRRLQELNDFKTTRERDGTKFLEEAVRKCRHHFQEMSKLYKKAQLKVDKNCRTRGLKLKEKIEEVEAVEEELERVFNKTKPFIRK